MLDRRDRRRCRGRTCVLRRREQKVPFRFAACRRRRPTQPPVVTPALTSRCQSGVAVERSDNRPHRPADGRGSVANRSLDELNRDSPLQPAFFLRRQRRSRRRRPRASVAGNVDVLKKYPQWVVTIEGHCDERGTAEYNLALGERRAAGREDLHRCRSASRPIACAPSATGTSSRSTEAHTERRAGHGTAARTS